MRWRRYYSSYSWRWRLSPCWDRRFAAMHQRIDGRDVRRKGRLLATGRRLFFCARSTGKFADHGCVFAHLVAELLIHANDHRIRRFDIRKRGLQALAHFIAARDAPPCGEDLVDETWLLRRLHDLEHAR